MSTRYNNQDKLYQDKLEASTFLIYDKKYRELSNDAKMMYQYLIKRFSVTEMKKEIAVEENTMDKFSFEDEKGDLFCFCSNDELRFVLNISEKTVTKCKKELAKVKLLEEVKQTSPKTNRLYLNKIPMDVKIKAGFHQELQKFKTEMMLNRKAKNSKRVPKKEVKSEPQNLQFTTASSEPQNIRFSEPQDLRFMNRKIYGHSTKEGFSTNEFNSTDEQSESKSVSLSIDDVLNELPEIPLLIRKQISLNQKRLIDDKIDVFDIVTFYKSTENTIHDTDFAMILSNVLTKTKAPIGNFHSVMRKAIINWREEYHMIPVDDVEEQLPDDFFRLPGTTN